MRATMTLDQVLPPASVPSFSRSTSPHMRHLAAGLTLWGLDKLWDVAEELACPQPPTPGAACRSRVPDPPTLCTAGAPSLGMTTMAADGAAALSKAERKALKLAKKQMKKEKKEKKSAAETTTAAAAAVPEANRSSSSEDTVVASVKAEKKAKKEKKDKKDKKDKRAAAELEQAAGAICVGGIGRMLRAASSTPGQGAAGLGKRQQGRAQSSRGIASVLDHLISVVDHLSSR